MFTSSCAASSTLTFRRRSSANSRTGSGLRLNLLSSNLAGAAEPDFGDASRGKLPTFTISELLGFAARGRGVGWAKSRIAFSGEWSGR